MPDMKAGGRKHHKDGEGNGDNGQADLVGSFQCGAVGVFASCAGHPFDVFDFHDRVVDQDAGQQRQGEEQMMFSEKPIRSMAEKVGIIDSGSEIAVMTVARMSRRKSRTMMTARMAPSNRVEIAAS